MNKGPVDHHAQTDLTVVINFFPLEWVADRIPPSFGNVRTIDNSRSISHHQICSSRVSRDVAIDLEMGYFRMISFDVIVR
jgi:hypothetical protein